ncbi:hypothetical protein [Chitinophaga rhizophila]|uniref:Uncharacterized protein n=1 Tax=Chitinophaga rhizophila TaxID=2866212 RepID=A0ABS7G6Q3_9BACT|nr:hypothetical protein [Chitinophaga rhizophila]MBW8683336.1 hypothetical protein [Chitinophaga rhizophila]
MNKVSQQQVTLLRQRVPIGLSDGLRLLKQTDNDIDLAEQIFKEEMLKMVVNKTGIEPDIALMHLHQQRYHVDAALQAINEERFSLTERIYRRHGNKEFALERIVDTVRKAYHIDLNKHLELKDVHNVPREVCCLLVVMDWLCYTDYEGFDIGLTFELTTITTHVEEVLALPALAQVLERAADIRTSIFNDYDAEIAIENYITAANALAKDVSFQECESTFLSQRVLLIERLYDLVGNNISKFP